MLSGISPAKLAKKRWQKWRFNQQWQAFLSAKSLGNQVNQVLSMWPADGFDQTTDMA